jgi:Methylamine utilisation protein MauE
MINGGELNILGIVAGTLMCLVFARAMLHKVGNFHEFLGYLTDYRVAPAQIAVHLARLSVLAELAVVIGLNVPSIRLASVLVGIGLLLVYATAIAINLNRGRTEIQCGCGGPAQSLSWFLVVRNVTLCVIMTMAASLDMSPLSPVEVAVAIAGALIFWMVYLLIEQIHNNSLFVNRDARS